MNQSRWIYTLLAIALIIGLKLGCKSKTSVVQVEDPTRNSVTVDVKVDEQLASSAVITPRGGTLTAQGADGTKFTLTIPKDALRSDEKITLTPATRIDGLPFSGGLIGAVKMDPEGLRLFQPATLTIEPRNTMAATGFEMVAFAYHQNGEGLYLKWANVNGNLLTIDVWHFSGAGATQGTSTEIQNYQSQYVPSNDEDAFTQRVREYLGREKQAQLLGTSVDPQFETKMGAFSREAYDSFIGPQLPVALQDCAAMPGILSRALGWARQVQLLWGETKFKAEVDKILQTWNQAKVNCTRCYKVVDPGPPTSYSGTVCDFSQPFTIVEDKIDLKVTIPVTFTPTSSGAGTLNADVTASIKSGSGELVVRWVYTGTYTVEGLGTNAVTIRATTKVCVTSGGMSNCLDLTYIYNLVPVTTN
jgi:hypothetical protein